MVSIIIIIVLFLVIGLTNNKRTHDPKVHFCNKGMEGHERRVVDFYGDDYDEILRERKKIDSGELKRVSVDINYWIKGHDDNEKTE